MKVIAEHKDKRMDANRVVFNEDGTLMTRRCRRGF